MKHDFNELERAANNHFTTGRPGDALKIYLFMADGDTSLDGGYLGKKIGECYEALEDLHAAKYWYGRAVEENPEVRLDCVAALKRLGNLPIDHLL